LHNSSIDPRRPYRCYLPSGKHIDLFFYDGNVAQDVAFKGLLNNGKAFAERLIHIADDNEKPQLVHIATDGESYGHHHKHGEMALSACLQHIRDQEDVELINYGAYLEKFPPEYEVRIHENSSWSCVHGVERWQSNCGCNTGGRPHWNQNWRQPLRKLLDWLRDEVNQIYEREAPKFLNDPWEARNQYIDLVLNRQEHNIQQFINKQARRELHEQEVMTVLRMMEMQRNTLLMFTSCAWFFDEVSGIETDQVLQYALRAIYYANQVGRIDMHSEFLNRLEQIPSNMYENGAASYKKNIIPTRLNLERVGMHYAIASLFENNPAEVALFNYKVLNEAFDKEVAGRYRLVMGRTTVKSKITLSKERFSFAVLYLGQQNIIGNISTDISSAQFEEMRKTLLKEFRGTDLGRVIGSMQHFLGSEKFSIWHLFRDQKRAILKQVTETSLKQVEHGFRTIYKDNYQLMTGMLKSKIPVPSAYRGAIQYVINSDLQSFFEKDILNLEQIDRLATEIQMWNLEITDPQALKLAAGERIFYEIRKIDYLAIPKEQIDLLVRILSIFNDMDLDLDIWKSQNHYYLLLQSFLTQKRTFPNEEWKRSFIQLGKLLNVRVASLERKKELVIGD